MCRISQVALIDEALDVRVNVHGSHVIPDQVVIQRYAGTRAKHVLLRAAPAEPMTAPPYCCAAAPSGLNRWPTSLTQTIGVTSTMPVSVSTSTSMKWAWQSREVDVARKNGLAADSFEAVLPGDGAAHVGAVLGSFSGPGSIFHHRSLR